MYHSLEIVPSWLACVVRYTPSVYWTPGGETSCDTSQGAGEIMGEHPEREYNKTAF